MVWYSDHFDGCLFDSTIDDWTCAEYMDKQKETKRVDFRVKKMNRAVELYTQDRQMLKSQNQKVDILCPNELLCCCCSVHSIAPTQRVLFAFVATSNLAGVRSLRPLTAT